MWTERLIIVGVIALGLASIGGCVVLHYTTFEHSSPLCSIAAGCVGALAGMSIPTRAVKKEGSPPATP